MTDRLPDCPKCGWAMQAHREPSTWFCVGDNCPDFCHVKSTEDVERERVNMRAAQRTSV